MKRKHWNTPGYVRVNSSFTPDFTKALNRYCRSNKLNRSKFLEEAGTALMLHRALGTHAIPILGTVDTTKAKP